jgi:hypothetical protein
MAVLTEKENCSHIVDMTELTSIDQLRSLFPDFKGNEFFVTPIDRSMDFSTEDVTRYNSRKLSQRYGNDVW